MSESVMVVRTELLQPFFTAPLMSERTDEILALIAARHEFIPRDVAEVSPEYRQIIPYVVIRRGEDYFLLTRTSRQTEARLHHKLSLGIGGHINPGHDLLAGLHKELEEEVAIDGKYALAFAGILNDESTEVSRVHLGAVYVLELENGEVRVLETEKMSGAWTHRRALGEKRAAMETWSQIVYDALI